MIEITAEFIPSHQEISHEIDCCLFPHKSNHKFIVQADDSNKKKKKCIYGCNN